MGAALLPLCLCASVAHSAHVYFDLNDFRLAGTLTNRVLTMTPLSTPRVENNQIISRDRYSGTTDSSGTLTISNVVQGNYRVDLTGPWALTTWTNSIPDTNILINAKDYIGVNTNVPNSLVAYSQAASDARNVRIVKTNGVTAAQNFNTINLTNAGSALTAVSNAGTLTITIPTGGSGGGFLPTFQTNNTTVATNVVTAEVTNNSQITWNAISNAGPKVKLEAVIAAGASITNPTASGTLTATNISTYWLTHNNNPTGIVGIASNSFTWGGDGDVNFDGVLDISDMTKIQLMLNAGTALTNWTPEVFARADISGDGTVDYLDLFIISNGPVDGLWTLPEARRWAKAIQGMSRWTSWQTNFHVRFRQAIGIPFDDTADVPDGVLYVTNRFNVTFPLIRADARIGSTKLMELNGTNGTLFVGANGGLNVGAATDPGASNVVIRRYLYLGDHVGDAFRFAYDAPTKTLSLYDNTEGVGLATFYSATSAGNVQWYGNVTNRGVVNLHGRTPSKLLRLDSNTNIVVSSYDESTLPYIATNAGTGFNTTIQQGNSNSVALGVNTPADLRPGTNVWQVTSNDVPKVEVNTNFFLGFRVGANHVSIGSVDGFALTFRQGATTTASLNNGGNWNVTSWTLGGDSGAVRLGAAHLGFGTGGSGNFAGRITTSNVFLAGLISVSNRIEVFGADSNTIPLKIESAANVTQQTNFFQIATNGGPPFFAVNSNKTVVINPGSAATPSLVFTNNLTSGLASLLNNSFSAIAAGNEQFRVANGVTRFGLNLVTFGINSASTDLALSRQAAGVLAIGGASETAGNIVGSLAASNVTLAGMITVSNYIALPKTNAAAPTGPAIYTMDNAGVAEIFVRDSGGTATQISPHASDSPAPADIDAASAMLPVVIKHKNDYLGEEEWIHLSALAREVEALSGKKFIYTRQIPKRSWTNDQAQLQAEYDAARLSEIAARAAGDTNVVVRPVADVRKPIPGPIDARLKVGAGEKVGKLSR